MVCDADVKKGQAGLLLEVIIYFEPKIRDRISMRTIIFLTLLIGVSYFGFQQMKDAREHWFLRVMTKAPFVDTSVNVDFDTQYNWTESSLQKEFEDLLFICAKENSNLGDRVCWVPISSFNGIPASDIAFFFNGNEYNFLRVTTEVKHHNRLKNLLDDEYFFYGPSKGSREMFGQELGIWFSKSGILSTYLESPVSEKETLLTWKKTSMLVNPLKINLL